MTKNKKTKKSRWFIPNRLNKFNPVALRTTGLIIFLAFFIAIPLIYNLITVGQFRVLGYATDVNTDSIFSISNQERINNGLAALKVSPELNAAALAKANNMINNDYWAHVAPDGTTPWSFIIGAGYQYASAGENLAKDFNSSGGVVAGWMASPTHRDNILNSTYIDVGYAAVNGILNGSETTLVVAMYGSREQSAIITVAPPLNITKAQPATENPIASLTANEQITDPVLDVGPNIVNNNLTATPVSARDANHNTSGSVEGINSPLPIISTYNNFNWGQKVSILLVSTLILLFALKHTMIWREQKRGLKHMWLRAHPMSQILLLVTVLAVVITSGVGVVL